MEASSATRSLDGHVSRPGCSRRDTPWSQRCHTEMAAGHDPRCAVGVFIECVWQGPDRSRMLDGHALMAPDEGAWEPRFAWVVWVNPHKAPLLVAYRRLQHPRATNLVEPRRKYSVRRMTRFALQVAL